MTRPGLLFVSNLLSGMGWNRGYTEELADRLAGSGFAITRSSSKRQRAARLADMVWTAWRARARYAVAHVDVFSGPAFVWAEAVCYTLRRLGKPYVLTLRGGNLPAFARQWPRRVRALLATAEVVTTPSAYLLDQMRPYAAQLELVPNAIAASAYRHAVRTAPAPKLVWLRAFHRIYEPVLAVDVVAELLRRGRDVTLSMCGPDKGDGSLARTQARITELGLDGRVTIVGAVPKAAVPDQLAQADILLNTPSIDNTPISVLEALAAGLCVVSTNVGGLRYLLHDGHDALLVPPGEPRGMASAVERILVEPGLAARLSRAGGELAARYDWSTVMGTWEAMFQRLATRA